MIGSTFERFTSDIFIPSATQQDLQALLDQNQYDQLFASFNIRNCVICRLKYVAWRTSPQRPAD